MGRRGAPMNRYHPATHARVQNMVGPYKTKAEAHKAMAGEHELIALGTPESHRELSPMSAGQDGNSSQSSFIGCRNQRSSC